MSEPELESVEEENEDSDLDEESVVDENEDSDADLASHEKFWLCRNARHDCYFIVGPQSGTTERIGSFKYLLMGYSETFQTLLKDSSVAEQKDIIVADVKPGTFREFLKCLCVNCENINKATMSFQKCVDLLYVVEKYQVTYVKEKLVKVLKEKFPSTLDNVFIALNSPVFFKDDSLKKILTNRVRSSMKCLIDFSSFLDMSGDALLWIFKLDTLDIDEVALWEILLKWATHSTGSSDGTALRQCILKHLKYIRFRTMSFEDFCQKVVPCDILTHTEVYEICKSFGTHMSPNMEVICNEIDLRLRCQNSIIFTHCVTNVSDFGGHSKSEKVKFLDFLWFINVCKSGNDFVIYLYCESSNATWNCSVNVDFIINSFKGNHYSCSYTSKLSNKITFRRYSQFGKWDNITKPSKNYVKNNSITVCVNIWQTSLQNIISFEI